MQLLAALAAGIRGCENGSAVVYRRGTSTAATVYSSFEGESVSSNTVTLDSHGSAEVYVNELVDVVCNDSDGVEVRRFTEGSTANNIEYIGQSFTGTDYDTALTGANKPTTLQSILNAWKDSAGQTNWQVTMDGAASNLDDAVSQFSGLFFNVKANAYGAVGDGSTDDTTAIQAAIADANVAGGTVYFPPGTYRIVEPLQPNGTVSFAGVNPDVSIIAMNADDNIIEMSGGTTRRHQFIRDLTIWHTTVSTGAVLVPSASGTSRIILQNCYLGSSTYTGTVIENTSNASIIAMDHCEVCWVNAAGSAAKLTAGGSRIEAFRCNIYPPNGQTDYIFQAGGFVTHANSFVTASCTASYSVYYTTNASVEMSVVGNNFQEPASGTIIVLDFSGITFNGNTNIHEAGNVFGDPGAGVLSGIQPYSYTATSSGTRVQFSTRETLSYNLTNNSASIDLPADQYGAIHLVRTSDVALTLYFKNAPPGARFFLTVENRTGSNFVNAITPSSKANYRNVSNASAASLDTGKLVCIAYVSVNINGTIYWCQDQGWITDMTI